MLTRDCQIEVNMFLPKLSALIFFIFTKSSHTESLALSSVNITEVTLMRCNSTQTAYAPVMLVKNPTFPDAVENRSIYCVYKFIAPVNYHVEARVVSLSTKGSFNTSRCGNTDYLRIWDGLNDWTWKPSEFCGQHENTIINVTRIASGREMKIEFQAIRYSSQTHYRVEVRFVKSEVDHLMVGRTYGGYMDVDGLAPKSLCNWNVHVERCKGYCELTSPGYPGIYPPLATCNYKIVNREGERVALYLSGTSSGTGRFDLKRSHECREDRVTVYDGETIMDPIIGIFCGEMSVPAVFSTGSALLVEFRSFAGLSPWHYTGFQARAGYKSTAEFKTGMPEMGSLCNWEFSSSIDLAGSIHTPDTYVHYNDTIKCEYSFFGKQEEVVELEIVMPVLREQEELYVYDKGGAALPTKIFATEYSLRKSLMTTTNKPFIVYILKGGQLSNPNPIRIKYRFLSDSPLAKNEKANYNTEGLTRDVDILPGSNDQTKPPEIKGKVAAVSENSRFSGIFKDLLLTALVISWKIINLYIH